MFAYSWSHVSLWQSYCILYAGLERSSCWLLKDPLYSQTWVHTVGRGSHVPTMLFSFLVIPTKAIQGRKGVWRINWGYSSLQGGYSGRNLKELVTLCTCQEQKACLCSAYSDRLHYLLREWWHPQWAGLPTPVITVRTAPTTGQHGAVIFSTGAPHMWFYIMLTPKAILTITHEADFIFFKLSCRYLKAALCISSQCLVIANSLLESQQLNVKFSLISATRSAKLTHRQLRDNLWQTFSLKGREGIIMRLQRIERFWLTARVLCETLDCLGLEFLPVITPVLRVTVTLPHRRFLNAVASWYLSSVLHPPLFIETAFPLLESLCSVSCVTCYGKGTDCYLLQISWKVGA